MRHFLSVLPRVAYLARGLFYRSVILLAGGQCGRGLRVEAGFRLRHGPHAGLVFGDDLYIGANTVMDCPPGGCLRIGSNVTLTHGAFISVAQEVVLGDDVLVGEYSSIRDANHGMDPDGGPITSQPMMPSRILIGSDVWIGRGCAILAGSTIGDGAVLGANSVLRGVLPSMTVGAGAPAKPIKTRTETRQ